MPAFSEQDLADLRELKRKVVKAQGFLCDFMGNCERETLSAQIISATVVNLDSSGEAFAIQGTGCLAGRQMDGTDNASAYGYLIHNGYIEEALREIGGKSATVIFPTRKLLDALIVYFARG